jgi:hypothetical protein
MADIASRVTAAVRNVGEKLMKPGEPSDGDRGYRADGIGVRPPAR